MTILRAAAVLIALIAAAPAFAAGQITVVGQGQVATRPDMATIRIGVETRARDAGTALSENNAKAGAIIAAAKAAGVGERDVQTANLSVWPLYEDKRSSKSDPNEPPKVVGFSVSNEVILRVRDLEAMGGLLTELIGLGANRMNGISFGVAEDAALKTEARKLAVANARAKAETYAAAAGVKLGALVSIEEAGTGGGPRPQAAMRMAMDEAVPVEAGETVISAGVRVVWEVAE